MSNNNKRPLTSHPLTHFFLVLLCWAAIPLVASVFGRGDLAGGAKGEPRDQNGTVNRNPSGNVGVNLNRGSNGNATLNRNVYANRNANGNRGMGNSNTGHMNSNASAENIIPDRDVNGHGVVPNQAANNNRRAGEEARIVTYVKSFDSDVELRAWLNDRAAEKQVLLSITCLEGAFSLFTFEVDRRAEITYQVELATEALSDSVVRRRAELHVKETFSGIYKLKGDSYLMVFRNK